jgi:hypothetical protein
MADPRTGPGDRSDVDDPEDEPRPPGWEAGLESDMAAARIDAVGEGPDAPIEARRLPVDAVRELGLDEAFDPREGPDEDDPEAWIGDDPGGRD